MDVGAVDIFETDAEGKRKKVSCEIDFVINKGADRAGCIRNGCCSELRRRILIWDFTSIQEMKRSKFPLMTTFILISQVYLLLPMIESESEKDISVSAAPVDLENP